MRARRLTNTIHSKPSSNADTTTRVNTNANSYLPNAEMLIIQSHTQAIEAYDTYIYFYSTKENSAIACAYE